MKHLLRYILFANISLPLSAKEHKLPQRETELPMQCTMPEEHDLDISLFWFDYCDESNTTSHYCVLDETVETLSSLPDNLIYVYGHTDARGKDDYNKKLSKRRAEWIAELLQNKITEKKEFQPIGVSSSYLLAPMTEDESDRIWNHRVEIRLKELK